MGQQMTPRMTRLVRGVLAASFATFVALFSHVAGGGAMPGAAAIALSMAFSIPFCMILATARASLWRTTISIAISQFVFHAFFSSMAAAAVAHAVAVPHAGIPHAGILHDAMLHDVPLSIAVHGGPSGGSDLTMWLTHAGAAILTIAAYAWGERAWASIRQTARSMFASVLRRASATPLPRGMDAARPSSDDEPTRDLGTILSPSRHRGPPLLPAL
jgi:hypothetical protein